MILILIENVCDISAKLPIGILSHSCSGVLVIDPVVCSKNIVQVISAMEMQQS